MPIESEAMVNENDGARADFSSVPKSSSNVWLFQAVPKYYPLPHKMRDLSRDFWTIGTNYRRIVSGDIAVLWQTGNESAGVVGIGRTIREPYQADDDWRVDIEYLYILPSPLTEDNLTLHSILSQLPNLKYHNASNPYHVSSEQWSALYELMQSENPPQPGENSGRHRWWWVNQTYDAEKGQSVLYSEPASDDRFVAARENVIAAKIGDHVIHYSNKAIWSVSEVVHEAVTAHRPGASTSTAPLGRMVNVRHLGLQRSVDLNEVPLACRVAEKGRHKLGAVFDKNGDVNEGYLYPVSSEFINDLANSLGEPWTTYVSKNDSADLNSGAVNQDQRAANAWSILAKLAHDRKTTTYEELAHQVGGHPVANRFFLEKIQEYCSATGKPPLPILVVNKESGVPGKGFVDWDRNNLAEGLSEVFEYPWAQLPNPFGYSQDGTTAEDIVSKLLDNPTETAEVYASRLIRGIDQLVFKTALRRAYEGCAFCGFSYAQALDAAHIKPWQISTREERIHPANGLLLCSIHHRLFDADLITLDDSYRIVFLGTRTKRGQSEEMDRLMGMALHGKPARLPMLKKLWPSLKLLAERNARRAETTVAGSM